MSSSFTISLDFELRWGIRDNVNADSYEDAILGGRHAIPRMLELFETFGVAATWATVGLLFAENRDDMISHLPKIKPNYDNKILSPYGDIESRVGKNEDQDPLHFGLSLIRQIEQRPKQEVGTHSFSHFYCCETGGSPDAFGADIAAARSIAKSKGISVHSIVLPRNQVTPEHLAQAKAAGLSVYRGNPDASMYQARARSDEKLWVRALRLADSAAPLTSTLATARWDERAQLADTPASRFLRPIRSSSSLLAKAQQRRITAEMTKAAKTGKNYHLWWHPHNFGRATDANIENLRQILSHFKNLHDRYDMQAMTMLDLARSAEGSGDWPSI